jgi:hypothetical protein
VFVSFFSLYEIFFDKNLYRDVWLEAETKICILMEYCKQGPLSDHIIKASESNEYFSEKVYV